MLYEKIETDLLTIIQSFFQIFRASWLVISLPKSDLFLTEVFWYGRLFNLDGMRFNPKNLPELKDP